ISSVERRAILRRRSEMRDTLGSLVERVDDPPNKGNACAELARATRVCRYNDLRDSMPLETSRESRPPRANSRSRTRISIRTIVTLRCRRRSPLAETDAFPENQTMDFASTFLERSRYYLATEYRIKIRAAVESLPDGALWSRPNGESNSVGNLLMHLAGNVRQWVVSGVGGATDVRDRGGEFSARDGAGADELLAALDAVLD